MAIDPAFCLFRCATKPLAVAVGDVAEIVEIDSLVRISLCPPGIMGLCPYHREVVPVVVLGRGRSRSDPATAEKCMANGSLDTVLIMETEEGLWGVKIDRDGTVITSARLSRHEPKDGEDGVVTVGYIRHGETDHALVDARATWRGLRDMVVRWYARINESASTLPPVDSHGAKLSPAITR